VVTLGGLEHLVVAGEAGDVFQIGHRLLPEDIEQVGGIPGLRMEAGCGDVAAGLFVAVHPAGVGRSHGLRRQVPEVAVGPTTFLPLKVSDLVPRP
jgi:hypothetical protein